MIATRSAKIENQFVGEGYYDLCLRIGELIALQELRGVGPYVLAQRFLSGEWLIEDVIQVIRLALIGGGSVSPKDALAIVERAVIPGYLTEYVGLAGNVIFAALSGVEEEELPGEA